MDESSERLGTIRGVEAVLRSQCAGGRNLEDRAMIIGPATFSFPIKVPIRAQDEVSCLAGGGGKAEQSSQRATRGDFEDRAIAVGPAIRRCSVKVPICGFDEVPDGQCAVLAGETVQRVQLATRGDLIDGAAVVGPAEFR